MVTSIEELQIIRNALSLLRWKADRKVYKEKVKDLLDKTDAELERKRAEGPTKSPFNPEY